MRNYQNLKFHMAETYLCNDDLMMNGIPLETVSKMLGTQIYDHDSDLCQGDKPND